MEVWHFMDISLGADWVAIFSSTSTNQIFVPISADDSVFSGLFIP